MSISFFSRELAPANSTELDIFLRDPSGDQGSRFSSKAVERISAFVVSMMLTIHDIAEVITKLSADSPEQSPEHDRYKKVRLRV